MPRMGRIVAPGVPHHVVQRGHNRNAVFVEERDYQYYLETLREWKEEYEIKVYAWCLMTNHVHLVLEPNDETGLGRLIKRLGGGQTRMVNALEQRTGTLWEGRYKSSPIQADSYLLACCRYVELNPVRARMVQRPGDYRWSSYRHKVGLAGAFGGPDFDPGYCALGATPAERRARYARFVSGHIPEGQWRRIRECLQRGVPTGNPGFTQELQVRLGRRLEHRRRGRPHKETR